MINSKETTAIAAILDQGQVPGDGVLFVHSAFRTLSRNGLRVEAFLEALQKKMVSGTLLFPTMSWHGVSAQNPFFDEQTTPSETGILSECFRTDFAIMRSIHPTHSVAGIGPDVDDLLSGHHLDNTPCSVNSPVGKLLQYDSHILLLGVDFDTCTLIHHGEEIIAPYLYLSPTSEIENYSCRDRFGKTFDVQLRRHSGLARNFPKYGDRLKAAGRIHTGVIFETPWIIVKALDLHEEVVATLSQNNKANFHTDG